MARRKRNDALIDTGPSALDVEIARHSVAAGHFVKVTDYDKPFTDSELEVKAQKLAVRFHRMAEMF
ncbi:hypothetical protein [Streptomyces sp. NPDC048242]|uniref:hypothetical protein n=1 Tax=Streptomyces sp. NPDC048242 TaxID=3155026 RepID=UPI00342ACEEA